MFFTQRRRTLLWIVPFLAVAIMVQVSDATAKAQAVKISKTQATVKKESTLKLKISGTGKKVKWSSSDQRIAMVNPKGKVIARKKGKVTVTGKVGKKKYTCRVTVIGKNDYNSIVTVKRVRTTLRVPSDAKVKITYGKKYYKRSFGRYLVYVSVNGTGKYKKYHASADFDVKTGEICSSIYMWDLW